MDNPENSRNSTFEIFYFPKVFFLDLSYSYNDFKDFGLVLNFFFLSVNEIFMVSKVFFLDLSYSYNDFKVLVLMLNISFFSFVCRVKF